MGYTDKARARKIRAMGKMSNATACDRLKYVLDMIARCDNIAELRKVIKAAGIVGPRCYEDVSKIPSGTHEHADRRRGVPSWAL
jgi:hypothetical protein